MRMYHEPKKDVHVRTYHCQAPYRAGNTTSYNRHRVLRGLYEVIIMWTNVSYMYLPGAVEIETLAKLCSKHGI